MIDTTDTHVGRLLALACRIAPPERHEWFAAMVAEFDHVPDSARGRFALGCLLAAIRERAISPQFVNAAARSMLIGGAVFWAGLNVRFAGRMSANEALVPEAIGYGTALIFTIGALATARYGCRATIALAAPLMAVLAGGCVPPVRKRTGAAREPYHRADGGGSGRSCPGGGDRRLRCQSIAHQAETSLMRLPATRTALAILAGLLGVVHLALTTLVYANWTIDALWFVGTGMAMVVAAAANVIAGKAPGPGVRMSIATVNIAMTGFFAAAWLVLPGPQTIIGGLLFLSLALCSLSSAAGMDARHEHPPLV
jgi:hypothetical protein